MPRHGRVREESDMRYLTMALTKGRLAKQTMQLLEKVGISCEEMTEDDGSGYQKTDLYK